MRTFLDAVKRRWFSGTVAILILFIAVNLIRAFVDLEIYWKRWTTQSVLLDENRWSHWLAQHKGLFDDLLPGASIAVVSDTARMWGMIWKKRVEGMSVVLTSVVKAKQPEVIIALDEDTAKEVLERSSTQAVAEFLQKRSRASDIQVFYLQDTVRLDSLGVRRFLRTLGLQSM